MPIVTVKKHKPVTPGRRGYISVQVAGLHKGKPHASLIAPLKSSTGRNNQGRVTAWQRGGGHKQNYRIIDWKRQKDNIPAKVKRFEYDPNRTAYIALLSYADGEWCYIVAPKGLEVGDVIVSGPEAPVATGNSMPLRNVPLGSMIHCIEMKPGKGAQIARSAGCSAQLLAKEGAHATLRLKSGEMRKIPLDCRATIGEVCKSEHNLRQIGKAGRQRWLNRRPNVRGVAMNPVDHPLGGGEGKTSGGRHPCTPWGKPDGKKTRNRKKLSNKLIVRRRKRKDEK